MLLIAEKQIILLFVMVTIICNSYVSYIFFDLKILFYFQNIIQRVKMRPARDDHFTKGRSTLCTI